MRQLFISLFLQSKKTLRTRGFIILFAFILLVGLSSVFMSSGDSGILSIAVYNGDGGEYSVELIRELKEDGGIIGIHETASQSEAEEDVLSGNADGAWIIKEGLEERINDYAETREPIIETLVREDNVLIKMAEEKLCATLFGKVSLGEYVYFLDRHDVDTDDKDAVIASYEASRVDGNLICVNYIDSDDSELADFSVSPLRGILYLAVSLTAAAAEIYYIIDRNKGNLGLISAKKRIWAELVYVTVPTFWAGIAVSISLLFTGLYTSFVRESIIMLLTVLSSSFFGMIIGAVFGSSGNTAAFLPVIIITEAVLSPIFIDFDGIEALKKLFPVYHGLTCVYDSSKIPRAVLYAVITGVLAVILGKSRERIRQMGKCK